MYLNKLKSLGIGQKLILFFTIGLLLILLSIVISSVILRNIDDSKNSLTDSSIPALLGVNAMSSYAHDLVKSSINMSESKSIYELNSRNDNSFESIQNLHNELARLKNNAKYSDSTDDIKTILGNFENNLNLEYETLNLNLENLNEYNKELIIMRNALESISHITALTKINVKAELAEQIDGLRNQNNYENFSLSSLTNIDVISELIVRTAELRKDLRTIEEASSKESVLAVQQEFDHSLRAVTRIIVKYKELELRKDLGPHILTLIKYGQDTPDIFDSRLKLINSFSKISEIHNENFSLAKRLNESVNSLSESVKSNTEKSAQALNKTIINSQLLFYAIAIISIIVFLLLIWKFVYNDIVLKLSNLSAATQKLSHDDLSFEIEISGHDEFSNIASALNSLKELIRIRKSFNDELKKQSALLKRSNEDLSLFAYIASHDLQEPLRVISSYSHLLSKRYVNKLDEDADKFIDYVVTGCSRMEALIEGLLAFSRVDTQKGDEKSIWIDEVLQDIKKDLRIKINETFALITWGEMPNIYADPVQIRTVFQNLISNAIKYNHSKPPKIDIHAVQEGEFWKFHVQDNGIGIDEKYYDKVFVIFKRLHSRDKYSGTGIGLSVSKKIIERYGGEITLKSNLNEGSTFIFTLPVDDRFRLDRTNKIAA